MYLIPVVFTYKVEKDTVVVKFGTFKQLEDYIRSLPIDDRAFSRKDGGWVIIPKQLGKVVAFASTWTSHINIEQLPPHLKFVASKFIMNDGGSKESSREQTTHDILFVTKNAPPEVIKAAYKVLSKKYHPDNKETGDAAKFRKIQEAYNKI